jgi:serine/threonine protein kinase
VVLELAYGGDFFDYVITPGEKLTEPIARYYFHKLVASIEFLHGNNVVHRDLKLENMLLNTSFHLKIADFGLSADKFSETGSEVKFSRVGTRRYMPPEMIENLAYVGTSADLFAAGVILFVMGTGVMPTYKEAHPKDYFYRYLRKKKYYDQFWQEIDKVYNRTIEVSNEFKHLVQKMLRQNPKKRLTLEQIKASDWYKGPVASEEEIRIDFT